MTRITFKPRLHCLSPGHWAVMDTELGVDHTGKDWVFTAYDERDELWLEKTELLYDKRATLADLKSALCYVVDEMGPPPSSTDAPFRLGGMRRLAPGHHQSTDGDFEIKRRGSGWYCKHETQEWSKWVGTLRDVQEVLGWYRDCVDASQQLAEALNVDHVKTKKMMLGTNYKKRRVYDALLTEHGIEL